MMKSEPYHNSSFFVTQNSSVSTLNFSLFGIIVPHTVYCCTFNLLQYFASTDLLKVTSISWTERAVSYSSRYSIHLWDLNHPGTWESKGTYVYYTDFIMELAMLFLDLMHHIHMLVRCSMTECMAVMFWTLPVPVWLSDPLIFHLCVHISLISFSGISGCPWQAWLSSCSCDISSMRCSAVSADIRTTCVSSITWRQGVCVCVCAFSLLLIITCLLNSCIYYKLCRFAVATAEELAANDDDCAICWDAMLTARKLPCGHLFHK